MSVSANSFLPFPVNDTDLNQAITELPALTLENFMTMNNVDQSNLDCAAYAWQQADVFAAEYECENGYSMSSQQLYNVTNLLYNVCVNNRSSKTVTISEY